jgi:hypothetical protein
MSFDGAVRTTVPPTAAMVCALLVLFLATGPVFGVDEHETTGQLGGLEEQASPADSTGSTGSPSDSLAAAEVLSAPSDSLSAADVSSVPSDSLAAADLSSVPSDSLAATADTLTADAAREPEIPRDPYAPGISFLPRHQNAFFRPWSLVSSLPKGLDIGRPPMPVGVPSSVPFSRSVVVDHEGGTIVVVTELGEHVSWVSYAAPLSEYEGLVGEGQVQEAWKNTIIRRLGKGDSGRPGGLLDIDIPMPLPGPFVRAIGPGANLKVRGSERITFGGQTSYVVEALETEVGRPSRFPQLDMEQQLTVNLEGTIGRKIHVYVDHRSGGSSFGGIKADQIRVRYDGDEDEIIQKIELGEVNLSLPGTEFVSYSGHHKGLFGAKLMAKVGKFDLVTVASKEEGKSSGASFTGSSEADSVVIKDISYKGGRFFVIDDLALKYADVGVNAVTVYLDDRISSNDAEDGAQEGIAYLEEPAGAAAPADTTYKRGGFFVELIEGEDYFFPQRGGFYGDESGLESGVIVMTSAVRAGRMLAVSYDRETGSDVDVIGGYDGERLHLKLIKHDDSTTPAGWERTRLYEFKHIYDLGAEGIPEEGFELTIRRSAASGEDQEVHESGVPYTKMLGLDTQDIGVGSSDIDPGWVDLANGLLSFPHYTPFCPDYDTTGFYYAPGGEPDSIYYAHGFDESDKNCAVYSKDNFNAGDEDYYIVVKYNRPKTTFYLGQINIIEDSEVVRLNGVRLTKGTDYTIYYPSGQLTLLAEEAKEPEAKVTVEYDYKPFGIAGEKTLLGARGVYNWSENVRLGTTWMYQSKGTPDDRPRLGEEPSRNVVGDVNLSADFAPEFMTRAVDAIPLINTNAESRLRISAEAAVSMPNPNTKGFVSVDDMEGAQNTSMLGVSRRLWVPSSIPDVPEGMPEIQPSDRVKINWYNPDRKVKEGDLHPDLPEQEADDSHTVLEMAFGDTVGPSSWAGLMRLLSKTGNDYSEYQFVELWINDGGPIEQSTGAFHIDLGTISEDFYPLMSPNGELDTEDVDVPANGFDADEDVGLDNVEGVDGEGVPGDDGDDDYSFEYGSDDYSNINGTEWNERLDTEDLTGNGRVDKDNSYWTLSVDLSDTSYLVQDNGELVVGNHWRKYRIPLGDAESVNGMASWLSVKSARIWVEGLPLGPSEVMIGSMDIVGSQWAPVPIVDEDGVAVPEEDLGDMSFRVGTKNTKEDADYDPPFDPGNDEDTNLPKREQSLFLLYENLRDGHTATARKVFYSEEDYTGYRSFDFYLHGDAAVEDGTIFFVRIGRDSLNYYEYSLGVSPGWVQDKSSGDNLLVVPFTSFTDLKLGEYATMDTAVAWGDTNAVRREQFKRVGWPSLSRIRRLGVGVRNDVAGGHDISGEIWLDDIRLSDVRKDIGWAERLTVDAKFADFLDMDFDLRHVDGEFRSLKRERGSGQDNVTYNLTGTMNADRFVSALGISTPVNVTWKRSVSRPKFSIGSDIVLDDEQSELEKTETLDRSIAVSLSRKRQSPSFWTHLLVDGISLRASLGEHEKGSPTKADTSRTIRGRVSYRYSPEKKGLRLFRNTEIFLKPSSIRFNVDAHVIQTRNYDVSALGVQTKRSDKHDKKLNADANIDFQLLDNLRTSHSVAMKRDLEPINRVVYKLNTGIETERRYSNSLSFNPKFGRWFAPQYSFNSSFTDDHGPQVRRPGDPAGIRSVRAQSSHDLRASFDIKKLLGSPSATRRSAPRGRRESTDRGARGGTPDARDRDPGAEDAGGKGTAGEGAGEDRASGEDDEADGATDGDGGEDGATDEGAGAGGSRGEEEAGRAGGAIEEEPAGPGLREFVQPVLTLLRNTDAIDARYSIKMSSRYDRITWQELPGWSYRLGLSSGEGADDRTKEHTLSLSSGLKLTSQVRLKGSYKRTTGGRWYQNALSDSVTLTTETGSMNEISKGSLSWNGIEKLGGISRLCSSVRARSGVEYKRSHSGPADDPKSRGKAFAMKPVISVDTTFKNGLTGSFSWDKRKTTSYNLTGAGSVTEDDTGAMSLSLNYRFSAPQGLKLPFFGQKLKFQSNLDTSLTLRRSSNVSRTAQDEHGLVQVDPTSATSDFSVTTDLTYSFSRSVSGGLQISFAQKRDEKRDQTRRTIGVHLSAEFKF